jgi:lysozyme family protein
MASIDDLIEMLLRREGGFVDHPDDRGGPTNFGITQATARAAGYAAAMRDLPRSTAADIYRKRYWLATGFDRVNALAPRIAAELFDTGVNMGPAVATGFLQRALNALNRRERDWPDIPHSRTIDTATLAALKAMLQTRGKAGETVLLRALEALQGARYIELAEARPANESFVYGEFHRSGERQGTGALGEWGQSA